MNTLEDEKFVVKLVEENLCTPGTFFPVRVVYGYDAYDVLRTLRAYKNDGTPYLGNVSLLVACGGGGGGGGGSVNFSAGTTSDNLGSVVFSNSHGVSFGLNGSTITASIATALTSQSNQALSASNGSFTFQTATFGNSNGLSFYTTNGSIVGSYTVPAAGAVGSISAGTTSASLGQVVFSNSNSVSFGMNAGTVTATVSYPAQTTQPGIQSIFGGTTRITTGQASFADSNGVSFGVNGQTITATVKTDYLTSQSNQAFSAEGGSSAFQTLVFTNSNGFSFSNTGGSVWGSYTVPSTAGLLSAVNISAGSTSQNLSAVTFADSNGVSFGLNGSVVTGTVKTDYLTSQSNQAVSAGNGSSTFQTATFADSNGVSFSTGTQGLYATVKTDYLTSQSNQAVSAGNGSSTFQTLTIADSNGVSFSTGTQGLYATVKTDYLTSQSNQAFSAQGGSSAFQTLVFTNSNGFSFSNTGGSVWGSYTVPTVTNSSWSISDSATSGTVARLAFTNLNGVTLSLSSGAGGSHTIVGSHNALTSQSNQALSAGNGSFTFQTASFADSQGVSFSTGTQGIYATVKTDYLTAQTNQTLGLYMSSNTTSSVSSGTIDARSLTFVGAGVISVGYSAGSIVLSAPSAAASPVQFSAGAASANLGTVVFSNSNNVSFGLNGSTITASAADTFNIVQAGTTGTTGSTFSNSVGTVRLNGSSGVLVSQNNSNDIVILGPNLGTLSLYQNMPNFQPMVTGASAITQTSGSSIFIQPFVLPMNASVGFVRLLGSFNDSAVGTAGTTSLNTTCSVEIYTTIALVIYSQGVGASSRSIQSLGSTSVGITGRTIFSMGAGGGASSYTMTLQKTYPATGANNKQYTTSYAVNSASIVISSNSNTLFTGPRFIDIPFATSLSNGNYWLGLGCSVSSASNSSIISFAGTCSMPISIAGISQSNVSVGILGAATSASDNQMIPGLGIWTTNASGFSKDSIGINSVSQLVSNRQIPFQFIRQA